MGSRCRFYDDTKRTQIFHCICRVSDRNHKSDKFAFEPRHKKHFIDMLKKLLRCFEIECMSVTVMGSHVHMILARHGQVQSSLRQAAQRYEHYYNKKLDARSQKCIRFRSKLNNISEFMKILQERFTRWYNGTFEKKRIGSLWNPRFKSIPITAPSALKNTIIYVELNPVRANMKNHPSEYNYCSFGMKRRNKGRHPFHKSFCNLFREYMGEEWKDKSDGYIISYFEKELARIIATEEGLRGDQLHKAITQLEQKMLMHADEFWRTGGISDEDVQSSI